jgi:hypothetical protein
VIYWSSLKRRGTSSTAAYTDNVLKSNISSMCFSDTVYSVIDFAKRNMIRIQEATSKATNAFLLVFLENYEKKTKELSVRADNE